MASGIPIVAKANEATIEVLGSDYPYLISGDDFVALSNAFSDLSNPDKSAEVVARNYKRLENFTDSVMEKKISDVYYSI
jgi:glycosyltransferase involved in cell wall biosynthesis